MEIAVSCRSTIADEIKRLNASLRVLREKKKTLDAEIYAYMVRRNLNEYMGVKIASVRPRVRRKPANASSLVRRRGRAPSSKSKRK